MNTSSNSSQAVIAGARPPIAILGVLLDNVTTEEAIERIQSMIASRRPHYVVTANVDFLVQATKDIELRRILIDSHLALCDGTPVLWASRLLGNALPERVAGSDLLPRLIQVAAEKGHSVFLLGAAPEIAQAAVARLTTQYPNLRIAGQYSPPFATLLEMDHSEISRRVRAAQPDLLFVGFGCPKQEKWIAMHYRQLGVPVSIGIGGTIDFLAGHLQRAPMWMRRSGFEWLFRLAQEPRRLFMRYANDFWGFGRGVLAQWWLLRRRRHSRTGGSAQKLSGNGDAVPDQQSWQVVEMPARLDREALEADPEMFRRVASANRHALLCMDTVNFVDSSGIGALIRLQKTLREHGKELVLVAPAQRVCRALQLMRLHEFFTTAPSLEAAQSSVPASGNELGGCRSVSPVAQGKVAWIGELTEVNASQVWARTEPFLVESAAEEWIIDLRDLRFLDSSGLGLMVKAKKLSEREGKPLRFLNPQPAVKNVLRISKMEKLLIENDTRKTGEQCLTKVSAKI